MQTTQNLFSGKSKSRVPQALMIFIIAQPFIDVITSLNTRYFDSSITFGVAVRALFMVIMAVYVLVFSKFKYKTAASAYLAAVAIYGIAFLFYSYRFKGSALLFTDLKGIIKTFYFPVVLTGLFALNSEYKYSVSERLLAYTGAVYSAVILIAAVTGTSFDSYVWFSGYNGWFYAANEIGSIIAMLVPVAAMVFFTGSSKIKSGLAVLLGLFACTYMGTKVPFFAVIAYLGLALGWFFIRALMRKSLSALKGAALTVSVLLILGILFVGSPLKKNLDEKFSGPLIPPKETAVQLPAQATKPLTTASTQSKKTASASTAASQSVPVSKTEIPQTSTADVKASALKSLWNRLLSNRLQFIRPVERFFENSSLTGKLLGIGYNNRAADNSIYSKPIEMDFLDIAFSHGYIGFILFFSPLFLALAYLAVKIFQHFKEFFASFETCTYLYTLLISLAVAFSTGHTLVAPAVSIYIAIITMILVRSAASGFRTDATAPESIPATESALQQN